MHEPLLGPIAIPHPREPSPWDDVLERVGFSVDQETLVQREANVLSFGGRGLPARRSRVQQNVAVVLGRVFGELFVDLRTFFGSQFHQGELIVVDEIGLEHEIVSVKRATERW